jgi:hypothetical protein
MVQIQVSGPAHSKRGYLMVELARFLRSMDCEVVLQGEDTHLADKTPLADEQIKAKLAGIEVRITELQTS